VNKFAIIEEFINKILTKVMDLLSGLIVKSTPKKVSSAIDSTKKSVQNKKQKVNAATKKAKEKSLGSIINVQKYALGLKEKAMILVGTLIVFFKTFKPSDIDPTKIKLFFDNIFTPLKVKIKAVFSSVQPQTMAGIVIGGTVISLGTLGIYTSSKDIEEKKGVAREPAAVVENATEISKRAHYYKQREKEFRILNQFIPLSVTGEDRTRSIRIDFTFISSNRYIKEYFQANLFLIKDKLNTTLQPIVPSFPLEKEGQKILKDKIKVELNTLIKERKIKGEIKEVHIHSILAG
jgi:flagellar basal body-associated protein FliL